MNEHYRYLNAQLSGEYRSELSHVRTYLEQIAKLKDPESVRRYQLFLEGLRTLVSAWVTDWRQLRPDALYYAVPVRGGTLRGPGSRMLGKDVARTCKQGEYAAHQLPPLDPAVLRCSTYSRP